MGKRSRYALWLLSVIVLALLVFQTPLLDRARGFTWDIWVKTIGRAFDIGTLSISNDVAQQIATLKSENISLKSQLFDYERLKEQLRSPSIDDFAVVAAKVVTKPIDTFHSQYVLNKGANDGVVLGAPAVINGSTVVGFVVELNESSSILQLLFHPDTNLPVEVFHEDSSGRGLVVGQSFTSVKLTTVPRDVILRSNQEVLTVQQENIIPHGLLVGNIKEVVDDIHEPYQSAQIELPYDVDDIRAVSLMIKR